MRNRLFLQAVGITVATAAFIFGLAWFLVRITGIEEREVACKEASGVWFTAQGGAICLDPGAVIDVEE